MSIFLVSMLFLLACTEKIPDKPNDANTPSEYQVESVLSHTRAIRIEGAWTPPVNIASHVVATDADGEVRSLTLVEGSEGSVLSAYQLLSQRNLESGKFNRIESYLGKNNSGSDTWSPLPVPDLSPILPVSALQADKKLLSIKLNKITGDVISLWTTGASVYIASYQASGGWKKIVKVQSNSILSLPVIAKLKILNNGRIVVLTPIDGALNSLKIWHYSDSLDLLSSASLNSVVFNTIELQETSSGLLVVWFTETDAITQTAKLQSAEYKWLSGWQTIENIKLFSVGDGFLQNSDRIHSVFSHQTGNSEDIQLIYILSGKAKSIHTILRNSSGWQTDIRLDDTYPGYTLLTPEISFVTNDGSAAIAWAAQNVNQTDPANGNAVNAIQKILYSSFSLQGSWSAPKAISGDVVVTPDVFMHKPEIVIVGGKILVAWVEMGPNRSEVFINHNSAAIWGTPELVYKNDTFKIDQLAISYNESGRMIVSWSQSENNILEKKLSVWSSTSVYIAGSDTAGSGSGGGNVVQPPADTQPVTPITPTPPVALAAHWTLPVEVWTQSFPGNLEHHIFGPDSYITNGADTFLSLHQGVGYDPLLNDFKKMQGMVFHKTAAGDWIKDLPYAAGGGNTTFVKIQPTRNTGNAYALWTEDGFLFFNYFVAGIGWQTVEALGVEPWEYELLVDTNNNAYLYWTIENVINLAQYIPGTGLQATETFVAMNVLNHAKPIIQRDNSIYFGWVSFPANGDVPYIPSNLLHFVRYDSGVGWGEEVVAPRIDGTTFFSAQATMKALPNNEVIGISQDTRGRLYSNTYNIASGWGLWQNVDFNIDITDVLQGHPRITTNLNQDVMVTWAEETADELGQTVFRVYSNQYSPSPDANGSNWSFPQRIASLTPLIDQTKWHIEIHPQIAISNTGSAVAAWIDEDDTVSRVVVNEFVPGVGWGTEPDVLVAYDKGIDGIVDAPRVSIADDDSIIISWRQKKRSEFTTDYFIWSVTRDDVL